MQNAGLWIESMLGDLPLEISTWVAKDFTGEQFPASQCAPTASLPALGLAPNHHSTYENKGDINVKGGRR